MIIGVLGGSFCPPTNAHIDLAKTCIGQGLCDKVIFVPVNDSYPKATNIAAHHRLKMLELALNQETNIEMSIHEIEKQGFVSTFDSLMELQHLYPNDSLLFIAGADKMKYRWFQSAKMLENFGYIVCARDDINCEEIINQSPSLSKYRNKIKVVKYSSNISSTIVRDEIKCSGTSQHICPEVLQYIKEHQLYL